jgi:hypothetical protein
VVRKIVGSWKSFKELRRIWLDFGITMVVKLEFDFENFSIGNGQPRLWPVKFGEFLNSFHNFNSLIAIVDTNRNLVNYIK